MFPVLTIIVAFLIGLAYPQVVTEPSAPDILGCVATLLIVGVAALFLFDRAARQAATGAVPAAALLPRTTQVLRVGIIGAYSFVIYGFHWPAIVTVLGISGLPLVDEAVVLLPFAVMILLFHVAGYRAEKRLDLHDFTLRSYLGFQGRQYLLPVAPLVIYILIGDLMGLGIRSGVQWVAELRILTYAYPFAQWIMVAVTLLVAWGAIPFLMRWFWKLRPLPPGPLRTRLEEFSRREGFTARDILVMPTGGNIMNAAVLGIAGPFRYVLLTDALIEALGPDEVEAVFAHEAGHAKHNHMLLYFLFTLGYALLGIMMGSTLETGLASHFEHPELVYLLLGIGGFLLWFGIIFGFISRRFEQQADVFGATATSRVRGGGDEDPSDHPFVRALECLASQMGDIREVKGWRHFSLGERISFVRDYLTSEGVRRKYRRGMTALLAFYFGVLLAIGGAAAATVPGQIESGRAKAAAARAGWLRSQGRYREAISEQFRAAEPSRVGETGVTVDELRDRAREYREEATGALAPHERAAAHLHLALLYRTLGQPGAARDTLQDALMAYGDHPLFLLILGEALLDEGRRAGALLAFRDGLAQLPADHDLAALLSRRIAEVEGER